MFLKTTTVITHGNRKGEKVKKASIITRRKVHHGKSDHHHEKENPNNKKNIIIITVGIEFYMIGIFLIQVGQDCAVGTKDDFPLACIHLISGVGVTAVE